MENENKEIEFFSWIRKIEFLKLKKYYQKYYQKNGGNRELFFINKYLTEKKLNNFDQKNFNLWINKFKKENNFEIKENEELKKINDPDQIILHKIYYLFEDIKNYMLLLNDKNYNKFYIYKLIYFILGFSINTNKKYELWSNEEEILKSFIINKSKKTKLNWYAFENGPILGNIFITNEQDFLFYFKVDDERKLVIFEMAYFLLKNFPTIRLTEESYKTDPWLKNYESSGNQLYFKIKNEDIINYFKNNKPFFLKLLED